MITPFPSKGQRWVEAQRSDTCISSFSALSLIKWHISMLQKLAGGGGLRVKYLAFFTPEKKTMKEKDAQRTYMITNTATRLFLRSPTTSSETFTQDVSSAFLGVRRGLPYVCSVARYLLN